MVRLPKKKIVPPDVPDVFVDIEIGRKYLTRRQLQILAYAAKGYSLKQTAEALSIHSDTVKAHRRYILIFLGCKSKLITEAISVGYRAGILVVDRDAKES